LSIELKKIILTNLEIIVKKKVSIFFTSKFILIKNIQIYSNNIFPNYSLSKKY